jgi:hypothetical protein
VSSVWTSVAKAGRVSKRCESFVASKLEMETLIERVGTVDSTC